MTFEIQLKDRRLMTIEGELRGEDHKLGPGGVFTVVSAPPSASALAAQAGDCVRVIFLPDAPKTTQVNRDRLATEKSARGSYVGPRQEKL